MIYHVCKLLAMNIAEKTADLKLNTSIHNFLFKLTDHHFSNEKEVLRFVL